MRTKPIKKTIQDENRKTQIQKEILMAKKEPKVKVKCIDCIHSELTQWDNNPVIAKCPFLLYRQVANAIRECNKYQKSYHAKNIKKLTHNI